MGAGASIPAELDKDAAKECAGTQWKDEYDKLFDKMASNGRITRQQFLKSAPLQRLEQRGCRFFFLKTVPRVFFSSGFSRSK